MFWKLVGVGALIVLAFDTIASFASLYFSFTYTYAIAGSVIIYSTIGFLAFRRWGLGRAVGATLLVQVFDATLGWYITWKIGPGALPPDQATPGVFAITFLFVLAFAAICALVGSALARALHVPRKQNT